MTLSTLPYCLLTSEMSVLVLMWATWLRILYLIHYSFYLAVIQYFNFLYKFLISIDQYYLSLNWLFTWPCTAKSFSKLICLRLYFICTKRSVCMYGTSLGHRLILFMAWIWKFLYAHVLMSWSHPALL